MLILLLTSALLITLDLRGNAVFDAARSGFGYAMRPFEVAGDVITKPVARAWRGMTQYDDLRRENRALQEQLDQQRGDLIAAQSALVENRELAALAGLETLGDYDRVTARIIGSGASNFDQRVEIDRGTLHGLRNGMVVLNAAGLVGKITLAGPTTSIVMLATDPLYNVAVKVVGEGQPETETPPSPTTPSGIPIDDLTSTTTTTTTLAPGPTFFPPLGLPTTTTLPPDDETTGDEATGDELTGEATGDEETDEATGDQDPLDPPTQTTTTTTTVAPGRVTRETGRLNGMGGDRLPRITLIADTPQFGLPAVGDAVLTAGGSKSLAPPDIPVGRIANVIRAGGSQGLELEVELSADLDHLNFLTVLLYLPPSEVIGLDP